MTHSYEFPPGRNFESAEAQKETFWNKEMTALVERNQELSRAHEAQAEQIAERQAKRLTILVTCMDERDFNAEEGFGLLPGEAEVFASGGGKIGAEDFKRLYGAAMEAAAKAGKEIEVYFAPHECSDGGHLGCAAFKNDTEAQKAFFSGLKEEVLRMRPEVKAHVLAYDTSTSHLRRVDADANDPTLEPMMNANEQGGQRWEDAQHAGYGVYVGDAYRAWVENRNAYFRLAAMDAALAGDAGIAVTVMEHHSDVDLSDKPIIFHVDYPKYEDAERTVAAETNINGQIETFLATPRAKELLESGDLKIVRTSTDMKTWKGEMLP